MAKKEKSDIYVNGKKLFRLLYEAQFDMPKRDRPVLAVRLLDHTERMLAFFNLAFDTEKKLKNIDKMLAEYAILKVLVSFACDAGKLEAQSRKTAIQEMMIRLEESMAKWRGYVVSARQDQSSCGSDRT